VVVGWRLCRGVLMNVQSEMVRDSERGWGRDITEIVAGKGRDDDNDADADADADAGVGGKDCWISVSGGML